MGKNRTRPIALGLCLWLTALCLCPATVAQAMSLGGRPPQSGGQGGVYHVTLDAQTVGQGQVLSFETVAGELAGNPFAGDYYPGSLSVELAGPIVIERGGCLSIGTLSVGNPKEQSPVIRGELCSQGLIVVKAGGSLALKTANLDLTGQGLFLVQEPGGSVELMDTAVADGLVQWAPPTVDNTYQRPLTLWLEEGTALTEDLLPRTMEVPVQDRGEAEQRELALAWDLADYDGRTQGEWTATGKFLDGDGAALPSVRTLEASVRWVAPQRLVVTRAVWLGNTAATAKLELKELPGQAMEVWGEVSTDQGESWACWERFELRQSESVTAGVFSLSNATPRHFRLRAANADGSELWTSEAFLLPKGGASDQGGNRGGSTAVTRPSRVPASPSPEPTATATPAPTPTVEPTSTATPTVAPSMEPPPTATAGPTPTAAVEPSTQPTPPAAPSVEPPPGGTAAVEPTPTVTAKPSPEPTPTGTVGPTPTVATKPAPSAAPTSPPTSEPTPPPAPAPRHLPAAVQVLLVAAGLGVCVSLGVAFTRKRK